MSLAATGAFVLALIKPQFEVGRGMVGKGGVVRDTSLLMLFLQTLKAGCQ